MLENRYIIVLPLKKGPHRPDREVTFWDTCPRSISLTKRSHYYIIGGQHTMEAHKVLIDNEEIPPLISYWHRPSTSSPSGRNLI